jgi:hypothetical protein
MEHILLILVLLGDPSGADLAKQVGEDLVRRGGERVQVLVGPEASASLKERDLSVKDLLVTPNIGSHLTAGDPPAPIVIIHIDRSERTGDVIVESRVWVDGRAERHVAIAGAGSDPFGAVSAGIIGLMGHRLGINVKQGPPDDIELARMAEKGQWLELLGKMAPINARTPRQRYYEVLAYVKLGQRDPAVQALNLLRAEHPGHFLIAAAEELIPPPVNEDGSPKDIVEPPLPDDESNSLIDPVVVDPVIVEPADEPAVPVEAQP